MCLGRTEEDYLPRVECFMLVFLHNVYSLGLWYRTLRGQMCGLLAGMEKDILGIKNQKCEGKNLHATELYGQSLLFCGSISSLKMRV